MFRSNSEEDIYKELDTFIGELKKVEVQSENKAQDQSEAENEARDQSEAENEVQAELKCLDSNLIMQIERNPIQKIKNQVLREIINIQRSKQEKLHAKSMSQKIFEEVCAGRISNALIALKTINKDMQKYIAFTSNLTSTCFSADFFFQAGYKKEAIEISKYVLKKSKSVKTSANILSIAKKHDVELQAPISDYMLNVYHWLIVNKENFLKEYFECSTFLRFDKYIAKKKYTKAAEILSCYQLDDHFYQICKSKLDKEDFQEISKHLTYK